MGFFVRCWLSSFLLWHCLLIAEQLLGDGRHFLFLSVFYMVMAGWIEFAAFRSMIPLLLLFASLLYNKYLWSVFGYAWEVVRFVDIYGLAAVVL